MKRFIVVSSLSVIIALCGFISESAAAVFNINVTSEGQSFSKDFNAMTDMVNELDIDSIKANIPAYTDNSALVARLDYRGLPLTTSFAQNSTTLVLAIPSLGINQSFTGATREASVDLMEDFFKGQNGDLFTRLFQELAAKTANDPVAGNPNSLEANTVQSSFDNGFTSKVSETQTSAECATAQGASGAAKSVNAGLIGLAASYGYMRAGNLASNSYRVPLSYSFRSNTDPNRQLNVRLPVTLVDVEGAQSWGIGAGLSYTWPITCNWFITPGVDYGLVASVDMASVGQMVTGSLTSAYVIDMGKTSLSIGNMVGYGQTLPFTYQDYTFDPDIQNTILRNGVMWMVPTEFMIKNTAVELFVTDTRYFGSDLFIDNYQEFGFSYGFRKTASKTKGSTIKNLLRYLRAGVTYIYSEQSSGVKLNFGYTF